NAYATVAASTNAGTDANRRPRRALGRRLADLHRSGERSNGAYLTLIVLSPESLGDWPLWLFTRRHTYRCPVLSVKCTVNFDLPFATLTVAFWLNDGDPPSVFITRTWIFAPLDGAPGLIVPETVTLPPFLATLTELKLTLVLGLDPT